MKVVSFASTNYFIGDIVRILFFGTASKNCSDLPWFYIVKAIYVIKIGAFLFLVASNTSF